MPSTTQRRAGRLALHETDRFFDLSRDLLATPSSDGCFRRLNGFWREVLGYDEPDVRGRSREHDLAMAAVRRALVQRPPRIAPCRCGGLGGRLRPVSLSADVAHHATGEVAGVLAAPAI
jgi:hypothetical protein